MSLKFIKLAEEDADNDQKLLDLFKEQVRLFKRPKKFHLNEIDQK
jgi:hypothetical protein